MANIIERIGNENTKPLPTIRLHKVAIRNIRSVEDGEIEFPCSKKFIAAGTESDILGIYGQNGSGKTAFIQVLNVLKCALEGRKIPYFYSDLVKAGTNASFVNVFFDFQYPNGIIRKVSYSFNLKKEKGIFENDFKMLNKNDGQKEVEFLKIYNESISCGGPINGQETKFQPFISVNDDFEYEPVSKMKDSFNINSNDDISEIKFISKLAFKENRSSIFNDELFDYFDKKETNSDYYSILKELMYYGTGYLHVFDSSSNGLIRLNNGLPIFTEFGMFIFETEKSTVVEKDFFYKILVKEIECISTVLRTIIPGLELVARNMQDTKDEDGNDAVSFDLCSKKGDLELPIRYEADGVRKIIMYLKLIIFAFQQKSATVAIDELDAGVFEYLLGEILEMFDEHGRGQLIFTSHNLRPLEILDKKSIYFTTSSETNRYTKLKNIGATNNLRTTYFRQIILNDDPEFELYKKEKKFLILKSLKTAKSQTGESDNE